MNTPLSVFLAGFVFVNLLAFFIMWRDKVRSHTSGTERIAEGILLFMAIAFGSLGVWAGMFVFRHKTAKWYFLLGIPLALLENLALLWALYRELSILL